MALVRTSSIVGAISGNLQSVNFTQSKSGTVVRSRLRRVNRRTKRQTKIRRNLTALRNRWRGLTEEQRITWNVLTATLSEPNRVGLVRPLTGWQLYMKQNLVNLSTGLNFEDDAPLPIQAQPPVTISGSFTAGGPYTITFTYADTTLAIVGHFFLDTVPTNAIRRFYGNWRLGGSVLDLVPSANVFTEWTTNSGWPELQSGEVVGIKWVDQRPADRLLNAPPVYSSVTVT